MKDEMEIAEALRAENELAMSEAEVPPSAVMWWRIQRRMRQDAAKAVLRVSTALQALTVIAAMVVISGVVSAIAPQIDWKAVVPTLIPLLLITIPLLTLAPLALYFVYRRG